MKSPSQAVLRAKICGEYYHYRRVKRKLCTDEDDEDDCKDCTAYKDKRDHEKESNKAFKEEDEEQ